MKLTKKLLLGGALATLLSSPFAVSTVSAADQIYLAGLVYRTGP